MRADLHVHSTASDGTLTASELVALALRSGLSHLALTDHDSVDGVAEAIRAADQTSLTLIPGVELSTVTEDGRDVHVLGYFVDHTDPELLQSLTVLRAARLSRAQTMVTSLREAGFAVELEDVLEHSGGGAVGRSHIARALVSSGHASSVRDAFERLIGRGRPHYVAKQGQSPQMALSVIADAGGVGVIAHPGIIGLEDVVRALAHAGLTGVEAYHADHTPDQRDHYAALAAELGLIATGGTDFHGPDAPNPPLGSVDVPAEAVRALLAHAAHPQP